MKLAIIVGTRPNFIKIAPLITELEKKNIEYCLVHTGQHYDKNMSELFFSQLKIPEPDYNLGVKSEKLHGQVREIASKLNRIFAQEKPDLVVVVGDVNSSLAGALAASKLKIPVAHIEAGLRSFDRTMQEEVNRIIIDHLSEYLFVTEPSGVQNLLKEGIEKKKIYLVGNILIDSLLKYNKTDSKILNKLNLKKKDYALLTLHRPSNVDNEENIKEIISALGEIPIKIICPMHPRTKKNIEEFKLKKSVGKSGNLILTSPLGYPDMITLIKNAKFIMTDSGGIQEETSFLKIPCLTIRENTERPITVEQGTNTLCGNRKDRIIREANLILAGRGKKGSIPRRWDGKTAGRIVKVLLKC